MAANNRTEDKIDEEMFLSDYDDNIGCTLLVGHFFTGFQ
jgi:hypothetical protein